MAKDLKKNGVGRPRQSLTTEDDWTDVMRLCQIQCSGNEIAQFFNISRDTLERRIAERYDQTLAEFINERQRIGHISLRRVQFQKALEGNVTMLIWLGKQYLGQDDRRVVTSEGSIQIDDRTITPEQKAVKIEKYKEILNELSSAK
jgi:hypothetical protein